MKERLHLVLLGLPDGETETLMKQFRNILEKEAHNVVTEISMISLFRKEYPEIDKDWREEGTLITDYAVISTAINAINKAEGNILIYDGFPRTIQQAREFLHTVEGEKVAILKLNTPEEIAIERRMEKQLQCSNCKSTYSKKEKIASTELGKCEKCGGKLFYRKISEETERNLLQLYLKYMIPAERFMMEKGILSVTLDYKKTDEEYITTCLSLVIS